MPTRKPCNDKAREDPSKAAAVLDAWSRKVVGYAISRSMDARIAVAALKAAIRSPIRSRPAFTTRILDPNMHPRYIVHFSQLMVWSER